ncbi:HipA N-terminal domain-containing protein [Microbacterium sp.]|uniref:HipA N-terminal domain-containing protein n=1 Tax=Microbacterium sp. TaxID=51671 RepID=UPI0039E57098
MRRRPDATPLSLSMPVSRARHPQRAVLPFLQGLLPDSAGRLDELAREFHTSSVNPFGLLCNVGRDVAGALVRVGVRVGISSHLRLWENYHIA